MRGVIRMIRKLTVALAATAVVGTAALAPSAANATWRGYGWYGHPYYSYPGYAYEPGYFVYKPHYVYPRLLPSLEARGLVELPLPLLIASSAASAPFPKFVIRLSML
jgi:hypothetical protein